MSLVHYTLVGHFDPTTVHHDLTVKKSLDTTTVERLMALGAEDLRKWVTLKEGYVYCEWASCGSTRQHVYEFAYDLARATEAIAVENQMEVTFPPEAKAQQAAVLRQAM